MTDLFEYCIFNYGRIPATLANTFVFIYRVLISHVMTPSALHEVFRAVVIAKLCYAFSDWWGFSMAGDIQRITAFIRRIRQGYCTTDLADIFSFFQSVLRWSVAVFTICHYSSPGNREAKVQRANVCLNCTEPIVAWSSYWSLPVGRYLSDSRCRITDITSIIDTADHTVFRQILTNPNHVLAHLLPEKASTHYKLRPRQHDRQLISKTT